MAQLIFPLMALLSMLALVPAAQILALRSGYVDTPGGRKHHDRPVPPIGGILIFPVFIILSLCAGMNDAPHLYFYIALSMIVAIGAIDDRMHVPAWIKFFIQSIAACLIVWAGPAHAHQLGNLFGLGNVGLNLLSIPFSIAAVVLLINAVNLMDGMDGLAGGQSLIVLGWLILACYLAGQNALATPLLILSGALIGFLAFNMRIFGRKKASIFLGDAGSLGLGLSLAWFSIDLAQTPDAVLKPISVAWILALPIIDVCAQFYRRRQEGRHPFDPDRGHFHHHLIHANMTVKGATLWACGLSLFLGGIGYLGYYEGVPEYILTLFWIILLLAHIKISRHPQNYINFFNRFTKISPVDN